MAKADVAATEETVFPDAEEAAVAAARQGAQHQEDIQALEGTGAAMAVAPEGTAVAVVDCPGRRSGPGLAWPLR
jgi:hypothetical protein